MSIQSVDASSPPLAKRGRMSMLMMKPGTEDRAVDRIPEIALFRFRQMLDVITREENLIHLRTAPAFMLLERLSFAEINASLHSHFSAWIIEQLPLQTSSIAQGHFSNG